MGSALEGTVSPSNLTRKRGRQKQTKRLLYQNIMPRRVDVMAPLPTARVVVDLTSGFVTRTVASVIPTMYLDLGSNSNTLPTTSSSTSSTTTGSKRTPVDTPTGTIQTSTSTDSDSTITSISPSDPTSTSTSTTSTSTTSIDPCSLLIPPLSCILSSISSTTTSTTTSSTISSSSSSRTISHTTTIITTASHSPTSRLPSHTSTSPFIPSTTHTPATSAAPEPSPTSPDADPDPSTTDRDTDPTTTSSHIYYTSTIYQTSSKHGGGVTTIGTITRSGVLNTNISGDRSSNFAHNPGAIAGVTVGAVIALTFAGLWIFLAIRRKRAARAQELEGSAQQVIVSPEGGWRPPLEDGDDDDEDADGHGRQGRYETLLASLGVVSHQHTGNRSLGDDDEEKDALSSAEGSGPGAASSAHSHLASSQGHYPYMTGFGQAAEMTMADGAARGVTQPRPLSDVPGPDPSSWFGGRDPGYVATDGPLSSNGHSSGHGAKSEQESKTGSSDDDPFARLPPIPAPARSSSSQLVGSSGSDYGSSSGHRKSSEARRQSLGRTAVPPTSYNYQRRERTSSSHSLKGIFGRLRGGRGSSPDQGPDVVVQDLTAAPQSSGSHSRLGDYGRTASRSPSPSPPVTMAPTREPTPPSSLLRPKSPSTSSPNRSRPTLSHYGITGERPWSGSGPLTLPPLPSPAHSEDDDNIEGLLDPRLPWRLEQARMDSSTSLRDHEDYSRPIGGILLVHNREHSETTFDDDDMTDLRDA